MKFNFGSVNGKEFSKNSWVADENAYTGPSFDVAPPSSPSQLLSTLSTLRGPSPLQPSNTNLVGPRIDLLPQLRVQSTPTPQMFPAHTPTMTPSLPPPQPDLLSNIGNALSDFGKSFWQGGIRSASEGYKQDGLNMLYAAQQDALAREKRLGITPVATGKSYLDPTANSADLAAQLDKLKQKIPIEPTNLSGKAGNLAGSLVGNAPAFALGGAATEGIAQNVLGKLTPKIAPKILPYAERSVKDALSFAPLGLMESQNLQDVPGNVATNALTGAVLGPAFHGVGEGFKLGKDAVKNGGSLKEALEERQLSYPELKANPLDEGLATRLQAILDDPSTSSVQRIQIENILRSKPKMSIQDVQGSYKTPSLRDFQAEQLNNTFLNPQRSLSTEPQVSFAPTPLKDLKFSPLQQNIDTAIGLKKPLSSLERSQRQGDLSGAFRGLPNRNTYTLTTGEQRALAGLQDGIRAAQNYVGHTDVLAGYPPGTSIEQAYADIAKNTGVDLPKLMGNWEKTQSPKTPLSPKELKLGRVAGIIPELKPRTTLKPLDIKPLEAPVERVLPKPLGPQTWTNREGIIPGSGGPLPIRSINEGNLGFLPKLQPNQSKNNLGPLLSQGLTRNLQGLDTPSLNLSPLKQSPLGPGKIDLPLNGQLNSPLKQSAPILQGPIKPLTPNATLTPQELRGPLSSIPITEPVGSKRLSFPDTVGKGDITNPKLAEQISKTELNYGNITNKDTLEVARKFIKDNRESALHLVMSDAPATAESNAVAQLLIKQANDTGKFDQAISMIEKTSSKAKTQGQAIQALSMWGRLSPEGVLKFAENSIEKSKNEHQVFAVNSRTKNLTEAMGKVNNEAAEVIAKEVESGIGLKVFVKPAKQVFKAPKLSEDIIKKLDSIESAARDRIANRRGNLNSLPLDLLADYAVIGTAKLGKGIVKFSTWSAEMVKEFGDDLKPHLESIWTKSHSGYSDFAKANGIKGLEAELTQLNRSVGEGLKEMNVSVGDIVRQHYSIGNKTMNNLVTQLTEKAGLSGEDAAILGKHVTDRMKELTQVKKEQILDQMFKTKLLSNRKDISQKIIELSNLGGFQDHRYKALISEKLGIPSLDEATAKNIYEQSNKIQTMEDGREKEVAIAQMLDSIAAKIPPSMLQKIGTLQTMAQLLNPKTAIRNIVGNAGFAGLENASNTLGAGLDKGLSLLTNQRTRTLPSRGTQLKGGKEGFKLGLEDALKGISTTSTKTQFDLNPTKTFRSGPLGKLETAMNIELRASDRAFYQAAYDDSLRGQMKVAKVNEPTEAMKEIADHDGLYKTFQDTNVISSFFSGFKKLLNDPVHFMGKANHREPIAFGVGDFVMKYPKTPGNLLARGLDYSPAGFVKVVMEASKPLMGKGFDQRTFVDALSRAIVGTGGLVGTGALLHRTGIISGKPDSDYDVAALNRQVGLGEYKVNISALKRFVLSGLDPTSAKLRKNDTLITYDWFQPQALPLAMGADIDKNGAKAQGIVGTVLNGLATGVNTFADQPVMQGVSSMFGQRDFSDGITKIMQSIPASFVPTFLNQVKQLFDNQKRNTYSPNWLGKTTNLATSKIPLLETRLQPTYDSLGKKAETYQNGSNNPLNVFLNPAFVSQYSPTKEAELALNAYKQTGETKQIPTIIPKYFTVTGKRFDLTSEEYANMQRIVGEDTRKAFSSISPGSSTTDKQIDLMAKGIEKARLEGKKAILEGRKIRYVQSGNTLKLK